MIFTPLKKTVPKMQEIYDISNKDYLTFDELDTLRDKDFEEFYDMVDDESDDDDDFIISDFYAYLEANKTYTFSCEVSGTFGTPTAQEQRQQQIYIMKDKGYSVIYEMLTNKGFVFTPSQTGKYYIRYDVNIKDETHSFWNFQIEEGNLPHSFVPYGEHNITIKTKGKKKSSVNR